MSRASSEIGRPEQGNLLIRGGTIIDGTGQPGYTGDVLIEEGKITAVGPEAARHAAHDTGIVDAEGCLITPGWVDIHTHYDGQVTWDDELAPSAWHGVTTIVTGNCGVGFAPVLPDQRERLIGLMEGVEDIPGTALSEGIDWSWETFPEYLDALDERSWPMDVGTQIAHGPVRTYVMGDRGARNEMATQADIDEMRSIVHDAIEAGALGFSTSRTKIHRAIDGKVVPGTFAERDELFGIGAALGDLGRGVVEVAPMGVAGEDIVNPPQEVAWMCELSAATGRPVTFALVQVDGAPDLWRELMDATLAATEQGADVWPQVAGRPTGMLSGLRTTMSFLDDVPAYRAAKERSATSDELLEALRTPEVRSSIVEWEPTGDAAAQLERRAPKMFPLGDPPEYEPGPEQSLAALAAASGRSAVEVALDVMLANDGEGLLYMPALNYAHGSLDPVREMLLHPRSVSGLADGGAHCGIICDGSLPTFMLTHWTRDRERGEHLPLAWMIKKQTHDTARLYGLNDRGTLEVGMVGDVNVIDYAELSLDLPFVIDDLPAGGSRILQRAKGYVATIKSGIVTYANGVGTGARPGRLLRGGR